MNKLIVLSFLLVFMNLPVWAKKDRNEWKNQKNLDQQFEVFKENLNFWNGNYFLSEAQLDEFFAATSDSIDELEKQLLSNRQKISEQQAELREKQATIESVEESLAVSQKLQNSITLFGANINKNLYSTVMYLLILGALVFAGFMYLLFIKSHKVTKHTKTEYDELKAEYEAHKKSALDRYTKINMELHKTRLELKDR